MSQPKPGVLFFTLLCAWTLLPLAGSQAGQVRVSLSGQNFSPASIALNNGDQVVWVWVSGSHTVTSGTDGSLGGNGIFNSGGGNLGLFSTARFAWKSDRTGAVPYYCIPHFGSGMTAVLNIDGSGNTPVSNFRITEVYFDPAGKSFVEIANLGAAAGNLGQYRLAVTNGSTGVVLPLVDIGVAASGGRVVVHLNESGTSTQTDVYLPSVTLPRTGSAALFLPNTVAPTLTANMMVDFVQWGASGQPNEGTADGLSYWSSGTFVNTPADGHSIEFCGTGQQRGVGFWEQHPPSPGNADCATPNVTSTWGRIKSLYR